MNSISAGISNTREARTVSPFRDTRQLRQGRYGVAVRDRNRGFNLIELMTVIAIGGVLLVAGTASYKYVTYSNRVSTEVNALLGDLMLARSEAIKEGVNVITCPSSDGATCSGLTAWQSGWIVFADVNGNGTYESGTDVMVRVQKSFTVTSDTFQTDQSVTGVTFNREGFTTGLPTTNGHVTVTLHTTPLNNQWTRCLQIGTYGALTTERQGTGDCS